MYDTQIIFPKHPSANFNASAAETAKEPPQREHWLIAEARSWPLHYMDRSAEQRLQDTFVEHLRNLSRSSEDVALGALREAVLAHRTAELVLAARRLEARAIVQQGHASTQQRTISAPDPEREAETLRGPKKLHLTMPPKGPKLTNAQIAEIMGGKRDKENGAPLPPTKPLLAPVNHPGEVSHRPNA